MTIAMPKSAGDKLYADEVNSIGAPTFQRDFLYTSGRQITAIWAYGNYYYTLINASTQLQIFRWKMVGRTLVMCNTADNAENYWIKNTAWKTAKAGGVIGNYVYCYAVKVADSVSHLIRIDMSDGTVAEMTVSGTAPATPTGAYTRSDGTYLYITDTATSTDIQKYSVSGTTATNEATITLFDTNAGLSFMCFATYFYGALSSGATYAYGNYKAGLDGSETWKSKNLNAIETGNIYSCGGLSWGGVDYVLKINVATSTTYYFEPVIDTI